MRIVLPVPDGVCGEWSVDSVPIAGDNPIRRLRCGHIDVVMSTDIELQQQAAFVAAATGRVLINGLGLGLAVMACLAKRQVRRVEVVEKNQEVIDLVARYYPDARVRVIHADALAFVPEGQYDAVWHDIFDPRDGPYDPEAKELRAKYAGHAAWQGVWPQPFIVKGAIA